MELSIYTDIQHLLTPIVTDINDSMRALNWCIKEMDRRYKLMAALGVRNINGLNEKSFMLGNLINLLKTHYG